MADAELGAAIVAVGRLRPAAAAAPPTLAGLEPLNELAAALVALAARLTATKRTAAAAKSLAEAIALYRRALEVVTAAGQDRYTVLVELAAVGLRLAAAHDALDREAERDPTIASGPARTAKCMEHITARAAALKEVVAYQREMERLRPERHLKDLTATLRQLSSAQSLQSQKELALAGLEETLIYYRELVRDLPDTFLPELAACLSSLSDVQSSLGRRDAAKASVIEAVKIYHDLNAALPEMASTLNAGTSRALDSLGNILVQEERSKEAVDAHQEAVAIKRGLAAADPAEHLDGLAACLYSLSVSLGDAQRSEDSLAALREAIAIYEALAKTMIPGFIYTNHVDCLVGYGVALCQLGQLEEALVIIMKAVGFLRVLDRKEPGKHRSALAAALSCLGEVQRLRGEREEGLNTGLESLEIYRGLSRTQPDEYTSAFAQQAGSLAMGLATDGDLPKALQLLQDDVVPIYRRLCAANPGSFAQLFYVALSCLADVQTALGLGAEAAVARAEAARIVRP